MCHIVEIFEKEVLESFWQNRRADFKHFQRKNKKDIQNDIVNLHFWISHLLGISPKALFLPHYASKSCKNIPKTRKREISTCVRSVQHPNPGQNIQQLATS